MLNKLVRGNKYTIVGNDGCLEFKIQVTLTDFMYKQYAQYEAVPFITFKKKGARKVSSMFLNYQYSFIEGWKDIDMTKDHYVSNSTGFEICERMKYDEIQQNLNNVVVSGKCGEVEPHRSYEGLIDYSTDLILEHGKDTEEYKQGFKEVFTRLNYSLSNDMIDYYKSEAPYFLNSLELIK